MFKTIEDETARFGVRMTSQFKSIVGDIKMVLSDNVTGISLGNDFNTILVEDETALRNYQAQLTAGKTQTEAFEATMLKASDTAKDYALSTNTIGFSVDGYRQALVTTQVTQTATNKSLSNCKQLINEYNSAIGTQNGLTKTAGMTQQEFTVAVNNGNARLGGYLGKLNGAKASMKGYVGSLIGAKAATIGLQVASMALNMALSMGIAFAIQGLITLADKLIVTSKEVIELGENAKSAIGEIQNNFKNASKTVEDYADKFAKLSQGVDTLSGKNLTLNDDDYQEFLDISNQLAETFPTLSRHYDENGNAIVQLNGDAETITGTLNQLLETERQLANQKIVDNLPDLFKGIQTKSKQYDKEIDGLIKKEKQYQAVVKDSQNVNTTRNGDTILSYNSSNLSNQEYLDADKTIRGILEKYGVMYHRETNQATGNTSWTLDGGQATIQNFENNQDKIKQEIDNYFKGIIDEYNIKSSQAQKEIQATENENKANWSGLTSSIAAYLTTNDTYNVLSDEAQSALQSVINNLDYDSLDFSNWEQLKDFIDNNLLNLFETGSNAENNEIIKFLDVQTQFNGNNCSIGEYQTALNTVKNYVDGIEDEDTKKQITLALNLDNDTSNNKYQSLKKQFKDKDKEFQNWVDGLSKQELQIATDVDVNTAEWSLDQWEDYVRGQYQVDMAIGFDYDQAKEDLKTINEALSEMSSATGLSASSKSNIENIFGTLEDYDAEALFERTANGIKINRDELRRLREEQETINKQNFADSLVTLNKEYDNLTQQIHNATSAEERNQLITKQNKIAEDINKVSNLASQYDGLTSAYQAWIDVQSNGESGDMYDKIRDGLENIKKLYDEGLVGTEEFRSYVDLLSGEDLSTASVDEVVAAYERLNKKIEGTSYTAKDFLKDGSAGVENFLNAINQINSAWASKDVNGNWSLQFDNKAVADSLGVDVEFVESMIQKLKDYGFDIDIDATEKSTKTLEELKLTAKDANEELKKIDGLEYNIDINFGSNDPEYINGKIGEVEEKLNSFKRNADGTIDLKQQGADEIQVVLASLYRQKQELEKPWVMQLDVSGVDSDTGSVISLVQDLQSKLEELQTNQKIGADTTEAQAEVQNLVNKIKELDPDGAITKQINFDTTEAQNALDTIANADVKVNGSIDSGSVDTMIATIQGITPQMTVNAGLDDKLVAQYDPNSKYNKQADVKYKVDDSKIKGWKPPDKSGTVWYTVKAKGTTKVKIVSQEASADGTAHARGTAFAHGSSGNWSVGTDGISLGGELGEEILVRDGNWYSIGANSAEFFEHRKGDIIFNAEQSKQIFKYGKITNGKKRGTTYASGTAFASGSGNFHNGNSGNSNGSSSSSSSRSNSSSKSNSNSNSDNNEKDKWDWIEIKLSRLERKVKNFDKVVKNVYKTFSTRNSNITKEISAINNQITGLNQAQQRYLQEANKVALSSDIKQKVREGTINISEYSDETQKLIKEYQEWYEKSLDCQDAIDDLNESISELHQTLFDNKVKEYESLLGQLENRANLINTYIEQAELMGYRADSDYYTKLIRLETENQTQLTNERTALINQLNKAVNDGVIAKNSEAWYEMKEEIDDVTNKIVESENAILEYDNTIRQIGWDNFDYLQETVSHLTSEADWLIDLMSNSDLFEDNGNMTDKGRATMGLHGLNYNTYMEQSMAYAREIQEIDKALAKNPADTKLLERRQELLETQREMITAAEQEKQAIKDMVADGIEYELDALQELIDKYQEILDSQKDLYDYQKNVEKQTKEIASLQKQLLVYNQNDSDEGRLKRQQLSNSLKEAQDELNQTEYERYISDQKKLLDEMYDEYEEILNQRLDNIDVLIQTCIDDINSNSGTINSTIEGVAADVGYELSDDMKKIWSGSDNEVLKSYAGAFNTYTDNWNNYANATGTHLTNLQTRLGDINSNIGKLLEKYKIKAQDSLTKVSTSSTVPKTSTNTSTTTNNTNNNNSSTSAKPTYNFWIHKKDSYPKSKLNISQSIVDRLKYHDYDSSMSARAKYYNGMGLGSSSSYKSTASQNIKMLNWMKSHGYKHGVYDLPYGEFAWTNEGGIAETIIRPSDNAILTPLKAHDSVLNGQATSNIWKMANNPEKFVMENIGNSFTVSTPQQNQTDSVVQNDINLGITLPNVKNYDQFLVALREDKRFEKLIQAITVDRLQGKSKLGKYNINIK